MTAPPRLELLGITKQYPAVRANDGVALTVAPGQIHAVLGENGAGKSTMMKIIYGAVQPDAGELRWNGELPGLALEDLHARVFAWLTLADERNLVRTWVAGRALFDSRPSMEDA